MAALLGWIILGLIAGLIAKAVMPGKDPGGVFVTIALGMVGSVIGGLIGRALFSDGGQTVGTASAFGPGFLMSLLLAVVGSVILLALYRMFTRSRGTRATV